MTRRIAIDGPSGAGKSTVGHALAQRIDATFVDTGLMYRALTLAALERGLDLDDGPALGHLVGESAIEVERPGADHPHRLETVLLDGRDVTDQLRSEGVSGMSSIVSSIPGVRRAMVERQRAMGQRGAVLNGRDIGTVVFPDADVKFFLTAVPEERAERRFKEDQLTSEAASTLAQTLAEMIERDRRDSTRADSPLRAADDAIFVDSTGKSIEQVFQEMMGKIKR